jgi:hypothetical protein
MACKKCRSERNKEFNAEINVHFPRREGQDEAAVLLFPKVMVCLECGFAEFTIPTKELPKLAPGGGHLGSMP